MKRILWLWALACGFLPSVLAQPNGVTAELRLDQTEFLSDEDMQLKLRIENRSGQDIYLGKGDDWINFVVTGENNTLVPAIGDGSVSNEFHVESAQAATATFNLTPFFDFRQPGHYTVKATFKMPQWHQEVACKPVSFTVIKGLRLPDLPDMTVGIPSVASNAAPEVRKYFLEKASTSTGMKLYFRLTDGTGSKTLRAFPIATMTSVSSPEAQIDMLSNLHVLDQEGAKAFRYVVIDPRGLILDRKTYLYTATRPELRGDSAGGVIVTGGERRISATDIPPELLPSAPAAAAAPAAKP